MAISARSFQATLNRHPFFRAQGAEELYGAVEGRRFARIAWLPQPSEPFLSVANRCVLPRTELWFCSYGVPLSLEFADSDYVRVQFPVSGAGATRMGRRTYPVAKDLACVSSAAATIDFGEKFEQVAWRIGARQLTSALSALAGRPVTTAIQFEPQLDLSAAGSHSIRGILHVMLEALDTAFVSPLMLAELEQALIAALLCHGNHSCRQLLDRNSAAPAPWQVCRVEDYIAEHWDQPITIEGIVAATGVSARTIFRAFKASRGCSPLEFARRVRLQKAHDMLSAPDPGVSVTAVAMACGYSDLPHFSRDFSAAFGRSPSHVLRDRGRAAAAPTAGSNPALLAAGMR